jgi:RNA polymerase sigma-70 factor (ECF subfamily)
MEAGMGVIMQQVAGGVRGLIVAALAIAPFAAVPPARIAAPQRRGGTQVGGSAVGEGADEAEIIRALRCGDEGAFARLVGEYQGALVRMAMLYVADRTAAEEVAQETWLAVLRGIDRFEGRSSLKTWIFRILTNRAQTRGQRESRTVPFAALARAEAAGDEPTVDPARFRGPQDRYPGGWVSFPRDWDAPEERLLGQEMRGYLRAAIEELPPAQRAVIALRDVQGLGSHEVCNILAISETNQRVLLHRARAKVRRELEGYLAKA